MKRFNFLHRRWNASKGSASMHFIEVVLIIILVISALFAAKYFVERENTKQVYYPGQTGQTAIKISTSTVPKGPAGISVGGSSTTEKSTTGSSATVSKNVVSYTDSGFSPLTLTVGMGQSVMFVNNSSKSFSLISETSLRDPGFAGFNAQSIIEPGQGTTFVFPSTAKTYKYNNRLNSAHRGTIVVQ